MPAYKKGWDGKLRLYDLKKSRIYLGLIHRLEEFAREKNYYIKYDKGIIPDEDITNEEIKEFLDSLSIKPRDYQVKGFVSAIMNHRRLFLSPTSSGKTMLAYLIAEWYRRKGLKTLFIVPTTNLILQGIEDFNEYSKKQLKSHMGVIMSGHEKVLDKSIVFSTWQSIFRQDEKWFDDVGVVIVDECHHAKASSIKQIMEKLKTCKYRFGLTGTLDGTKTHQIVLEGLFGETEKLITTNQLMQEDKVSELEIKMTVLKHPFDACQQIKKSTYRDEINYLISCEARNKFICALAKSLKGNTLILYQYIESHGDILNEMLSKMKLSGKLFYIHGKVDTEDRDAVRKVLKTEDNAIILASVGTFSTRSEHTSYT